MLVTYNYNIFSETTGYSVSFTFKVYVEEGLQNFFGIKAKYDPVLDLDVFWVGNSLILIQGADLDTMTDGLRERIKP